MKKAFTLVEILIVVALLGILAAIVLPTFQDHIQQARESAAKDNLRILRNAIRLYAAQHNDMPPGYIDGDLETPLIAWFVSEQLTKQTTVRGRFVPSEGNELDYGPYIQKIPPNPFNESSDIFILGNGVSFPPSATGDYGWIYKPATKAIKLDWEGTDATGTAYYDY